MIKQVAVLMALLCFLAQHVEAQNIFGFPIDETGSYGRDCQVFSGSVSSKWNQK